MNTQGVTPVHRSCRVETFRIPASTQGGARVAVYLSCLAMRLSDHGPGGADKLYPLTAQGPAPKGFDHSAWNVRHGNLLNPVFRYPRHSRHQSYQVRLDSKHIAVMNMHGAVHHWPLRPNERWCTKTTLPSRTSSAFSPRPLFTGTAIALPTFGTH